ncbi:3-hydroxyacyl-[acyl-carrier-protein] dehydratase FabZ [bacterium BMS3Abin04]|nr:3-hydroxyacyl-[acyl-carrier-protein] dehydratase FabZ [bacterium BMS3Abin04]
MAQTGGILMLNSYIDPTNKLVFFMGIKNAKFRKPVVPGDQLVIEAELVSRKSKVVVIKAKTYVDNNIVAEAELMAAIVDRENKAE